VYCHQPQMGATHSLFGRKAPAKPVPWCVRHLRARAWEIRTFGLGDVGSAVDRCRLGGVTCWEKGK
jgi:hypothetical protein